MDKKSSNADLVYNYVSEKIYYINSISDTGAGKAMLAQLRRGIGKRPGELPELWGMIFENMPEKLLGKEKMSYAEWAVYTALTLYALHRQGSETEVNDKGVSLGAAAAKLIEQPEDTQRILNRMNLVVTAVSNEDAAYHIRSLVQLFKSKGIGFDYPWLAKDLYRLNFDESADNIKLRWGREFYAIINK